MSENEKNISLEFERVSDAQMWALAQMAKRMYHEDCRRLSASDEEADTMASAVTELQKALDRAGYSPR